MSPLRWSTNARPWAFARSARPGARRPPDAFSPAAVVLMLAHCSKTQPARNRICAIPVETAQACKDACLCGDVSAAHRCEVHAGHQEVVMGRFIIAAAILLWCSPGFAQVIAPSIGSTTDSPGLPPMGDTAAPPPPGASAAAAALDGAGIPLGATDLFVGGLSPSPSDLGGSCPGLEQHRIARNRRDLLRRRNPVHVAERSRRRDHREFHRLQPCADGRGRTVGTIVEHGSRSNLWRRKHPACGDRASDRRAWRHDRPARKHHALQLHGCFGPGIPAPEPPPGVCTGPGNPARAGVLRPPGRHRLCGHSRCGQSSAGVAK